MKLLDRFSLALLGSVLLASLLPARDGFALWLSRLIPLGIALLFFLHGARLPRQAIKAGLLHWRLHLSVLLASFVLFPLLALALHPLARLWLPPDLALGLVFLCILPSTVQSSIAFTSIAHGNVSAAVVAASLSNLIGVFATPLLATLLLATSGEMVDPARAIGKIIVLLLLPFLAGHALQGWIGETVQRWSRLLSLSDRGTIVLVVYAAFSQAVIDNLWRQLSWPTWLALAVLLMILLGLAMLALQLAIRGLRFSRADGIAVFFCGCKKSLATGAPMAGLLFAGSPALGLIVLPLMLFHQLQLMVCAWLAQRWARHADAVTAADSTP